MRALIALLLVILFVQAVPAHPITLDRSRGPVFSAATFEVTLPPREDEASVESLTAAPDSDKGFILPSAFVPALCSQAGAHQHVWPTEKARGPPSRPPLRLFAAPRAPPHLS